MKSQTIRAIVNRFKKHKPENLEHTLYCVDTLRFIGEGSFRKVYQINDLPLVVKFPTGNDGDDIEENIEHSENEMDAINEVKEKHPHLKKYLPKIYYYKDRKSTRLNSSHLGISYA